MNKQKFLAALSAMLLVFSLNVWPLTPQSLAAEGTSVEIGSASIVTGGIVKVPINVKNFTKETGLGAYDIQVTFNTTALRVLNLGASTNPSFGMPVQNINNVEGIVYLNAFQARIPGPVGDVNLASLEVQGLSSGKWTLGLKVITLSDTQGSDTEAAVVDGIIQVDPGPALEIGSAFLPLEKIVSLPVVVKDIPAGKPLASYGAKISFTPASLKITGVKGGEPPYDRPPAFTIDPDGASVSISAAQLPAAAAGNAVVAYIEVSSASANRFLASISQLLLKAQDGSTIAANPIPGMLWALAPSTVETSSPVLTVGEFEAVSVQLRNIPSIAGLGSYELEIKYDPRTIKVARVTDWPMPDKGFVQASSSHTEGTVVVRGTIDKKPGPVGGVSLVELIIQGIEGGQSSIGINIRSFKDTAGNPMEVTAKPGSVTVRALTTVEIGSGSLVVGAGGKIAITIRDYIDPDGLGNSWIEIAYPKRVLEVTAIEPGDIPFDKPPQQQTVGVDIPAGVITITTSPARLKPNSPVVLANLTVMPLAEGDFRLSLRGGNVNNSRNQPIPAKATEGTINAKSPFKMSPLAIAPRQPAIKEKATLTATITNTGTTKAVYPARLWIGASLEESGAIEVEPNSSRNISFGVTRDLPGAYKAMLGEGELQFTVINPADLKPGTLAINPTAPAAGETVTVSERVENSGKVEGIYTARLKINQVLRDSKEMSLKPGENREVSFPLNNLEPGSYNVDLDGQAGSFTVSGGGGAGQFPVLPAVLVLLVVLEGIAIGLLLARRRARAA
ncbi:MAG: hypothetical protein HY673_21350 [Chloroflexi bacterium]|nr:hypothetical protein [Chloroflexota bacterium]